MNSFEFTCEQMARLNRGLFPGLNYLFRLKDRLEKLGVRESDSLFSLIMQAYDASRRLSQYAHYESVSTGAGDTPKRQLK